MERKRYSAEFKREAVKLASQSGMVKRQVAQELGIHENLLRTWIRRIAAAKSLQGRFRPWTLNFQ